MLAYPDKVRFKRRHQLTERLLEDAGRHPGRHYARRGRAGRCDGGCDATEVEPVKAREALVDQAPVNASIDDGQESPSQPFSLIGLPLADRRADRVRADHEDNRAGLRDKLADAVLPGFSGRYVLAVDKSLETAGSERGLKPIREVAVLAGIRNEDLKSFLTNLRGRVRGRQHATYPRQTTR